ncbi:MAG: hypothetical protein QOJ98_2998, partial [Acidobacteriota bacterium]|nr:hypothetical protein [Acidobacteriota bacterium]
MKKNYSITGTIGCRVPAPSVCLRVGEWLGFARQFPGKGTNKGGQTRRSRKAASGEVEAAAIAVILSRVDGEGPPAVHDTRAAT